MKDQTWLSPDQTRDIFSKICLSPPRVPRKGISKTPLLCSSRESSSSSLKGFFFQKNSISRKKTQPRRNVSNVDIGNLDQMQIDFFEKKNCDKILFKSKSPFQVRFSTPEKPSNDKVKSEFKILYGKFGRNRTTTPDTIPKIAKSPKLYKNNAQNPFSSNLIQLNIAPSYCFETQISEISPFTLGASPSPITINQNIVNNQPNDLELNINLDEVDALSFEAPEEINQKILNPNDITGFQKSVFPQKKSEKNNMMNDLFTSHNLLIPMKMEKANLGNCSKICCCGTISMLKTSNLRSNNLNLNSFVSHNRKSKYVSNRMKFEKQKLKKNKKKPKCKCKTQQKGGHSNQNTKLFVSEFFLGNKVETPSNVLGFSHLDLKKLTIHKDNFFS